MNRKILIIFFIIILIFGLLLILDHISLIKYKIDEIKINLNPNKKAELVFITDKNYVNYLRVALKSAIVNKNKDSIYNISILCVDLSDDDMALIKELEKTDDGGNITINTIPLSLDMIEDIAPNFKSARITRANFFKFIIPEILKDTDKVLFIDCDTLILKDLLHCYNTDVSDKYLGAVPDYIKYYHKNKTPKKIRIIGSIYYYHEKRFPENDYWYNVGFLLLNLKKMREDEISKALIAYKNTREGDAPFIESVYNIIIPTSTIKKMPFFYHMVIFRSHIKKKYLSSLDKVVVFHWAGNEKPDCFRNTSFADLWWKYAKMAGVDE